MAAPVAVDINLCTNPPTLTGGAPVVLTILRATSESHSNEDACRALTLAAADAAFVRLAIHVIG